MDSVTRFFASGFFHQSVSPQPLSIPFGPFRIFSKIRGDIRRSRLTTGVVDTGGKMKKSSIKSVEVRAWYSPQWKCRRAPAPARQSQSDREASRCWCSSGPRRPGWRSRRRGRRSAGWAGWRCSCRSRWVPPAPPSGQAPRTGSGRVGWARRAARGSWTQHCCCVHSSRNICFQNQMALVKLSSTGNTFVFLTHLRILCLFW